MHGLISRHVPTDSSIRIAIANFSFFFASDTGCIGWAADWRITRDCAFLTVSKHWQLGRGSASMQVSLDFICLAALDIMSPAL